jgi:hypothetical protein
MNLKLITTYISEKDYDRLQKAAYKGKKKNKPLGSMTFSEILRDAIEKYEIK